MLGGWSARPLPQTAIPDRDGKFNSHSPIPHLHPQIPHPHPPTHPYTPTTYEHTYVHTPMCLVICYTTPYTTPLLLWTRCTCMDGTWLSLQSKPSNKTSNPSWWANWLSFWNCKTTGCNSKLSPPAARHTDIH